MFLKTDLGKSTLLLVIMLLELGSAKRTVVNQRSNDDEGNERKESNTYYEGPALAQEEMVDDPHFRYRKSELGLGEDDDTNRNAGVKDQSVHDHDDPREYWLDPRQHPVGLHGPPSAFNHKIDELPADYFEQHEAENQDLDLEPSSLSERKAIVIRQAVANSSSETTTSPTSPSTAQGQGSGGGLTTTESVTNKTVRPTRPPVKCSSGQRAGAGGNARQTIQGEANLGVNSSVPPSDQLTLEDRVLTNQVFDTSIYGKCGAGPPDGKTCFEWEEGCIKKKRCRMLATIKNATQNTISVTLYLSDALLPENPWIGLGFSKDAHLGDDLLIYCIDNNNASQNGNTSVYITFIDKNHQTRLQISKSTFASNICPRFGYTAKGILVCTFELPHVIELDDGTKFELMHNGFYQILAFGYYDQTLAPTDVKFGSIDKSQVTIFSRDKEVLQKSLQKPKIIQGKSSVLVVLHVCFAVFSHVFLIPSSMIVAKYGREVYGAKTKAVGRKILRWLLMHIRICIVSLVLVLLSLITIFIELEMTWQSKYGYEMAHSVIGFISMGIAFLNSALGWGFKFDNPNNTVDVPKTNIKVGAWAHWFLGNFTYLTGIFCVITAGKMQRALAPCVVEYFGYIHLLIHIGVLIFMSIDAGRVVKKIDGRYMFQRAVLGPMIPWTSSEVSTLSKSYKDASIWKMRRRVIIFHFFTSFLCAFAICTLMLLPTVLCRHYSSLI